MSDYTTRQKLVKQFTGENSGLWGVFLNNNFDRVDFATKGVVAFTLSGTATLTFNNTSTNPANYQAIASTIWITGGTGGTINIPSVEENFYVINDASGAVVLSNGSNSVSVTSGAATAVITDGSSVRKLTPDNATTLPIQTGKSGKFLQTNGSSVSWEDTYTSGTWTPTVSLATPGTSSFAYPGARTGTWIKNGPFYIVDCDLSFTPTIGTGSGAVSIGGSGLPTMSASDWATATPAVLSADFLWPSGATQVFVTFATSTAIRLVGRSSSMSGTTFTASNLNNGTQHAIRFRLMALAA